MDIQWGYNNREGDQWKAAFICKYGLFEPTVMFFGLCNSPAMCNVPLLLQSFRHIPSRSAVLRHYIIIATCTHPFYHHGIIRTYSFQPSDPSIRSTICPLLPFPSFLCSLIYHLDHQYCITWNTLDTRI